LGSGYPFGGYKRKLLELLKLKKWRFLDVIKFDYNYGLWLLLAGLER